MDIKKTSKPVEVEAGKTYTWCSCGLSQTLPLCDDSHKKNATASQPMAFVAATTTTVYLCSCARTEDPPYCDGFNCDQ